MSPQSSAWLTGRVILVTGAAGALAAAVIPALRQAGATPVLVDLPGTGLDARASALGLDGHGADLADPVAARDVVARIHADHGRVDGVVHCAGAFAWTRVEDSTDGALDAMLGPNLRSLVGIVRALLPHLRAQGEGFIAGVASQQAWQGGAPGVAAYAAAKAGVAAWLSSLAQELADSDLRVSTLFPMGIIDTPANRSDMPDADPAGWLGTEELAAAVVFAAQAAGRGRIRALPVYPRG